ncbi:hypothetical protein [uncultured Bacteroides sp.]|uniref:hypothetical protein n=1 Tax=uncultured Bacteroides sp. TaxID=162156 RepID=UPI002AA7B4C6|nr:hypothetical protein [uncultured Bacteroides sp.]
MKEKDSVMDFPAISAKDKDKALCILLESCVVTSDVKEEESENELETPIEHIALTFILIASMEKIKSIINLLGKFI